MTNYTTDDLTERGLQEMAYERDLAAQTARAEAAEAERDMWREQALDEVRYRETLKRVRAAEDERDAAIARAEAAEQTEDELLETAVNAIIRAEAVTAELANLRDELSDSVSPTADALNKLWRDIILARNPDYGDWEYPGQAYRHIKAEFGDAEAEIDGMLEQKSFLEAQLVHMQQDLAALREQLAAREWQPVTEPPENGTTVEAIVRLRYRVPYPLRDDEPTWNVEDLTDDYCIGPEDIRGWRTI